MDFALHYALVLCILAVLFYIIGCIRSAVTFPCTSPNFGISPSLPCTNFKVQSRAVPEALDPEMSPSTSRQVPRRSATWIKTPGRLFGPLGEILKILARHETWNSAI